MSIFSDYKCGALSEVEFRNECARMNAQDRAEQERYYESDENEEDEEPCDDVVSRQAVLDAIMANGVWENEYNLTSSRIKKAVENLPSVQPKRTGRWIDDGRNKNHSSHLYHCSVCGSRFVKKKMAYKFCPYCGCEMLNV